MTTILDTIPEARALPAGREEAILADLLETIAGEPPARGRRAWRYLASAGVVAAGTAAVLTLTNIIGADAAYASWTASPSAVSPDRVSALGAACADRVRDAHAGARSDLAPVAAEQRGAYTTMLVAAAGQVSVCADWTGQAAADGHRGGTFEGLVTGATLPKGQAVELLGVPGQVSGSDAVRFAFGLAAPQVHRIVVTTTGGVEVTATVAQGHFLAWWPSGDEVGTLRAFDSGGREITDRQ